MQGREADNAVVQLRVCRLTLTLHCQWSFSAADVESAANEKLERHGDRAAAGSAARVRIIGLAYMGSTLEAHATLQSVRTTQRQATIVLDALVHTTLRVLRNTKMNMGLARDAARGCIVVDAISGQSAGQGSPGRRGSRRLSLRSTRSSTGSVDSDLDDLHGIQREVALCVEVGMRLVLLDEHSVEGFVVGWGEAKIHSREDASFAEAHAATARSLRPTPGHVMGAEEALQRIQSGEVRQIDLRHDGVSVTTHTETAPEVQEGVRLHGKFLKLFFADAKQTMEIHSVDTGELVRLDHVVAQDGFRTTTPFFLYCHVMEARHLVASDWTFSSDPYVRISCGRFRFKTPTVWQTLHPKFRHMLGLTMPHQNICMKFALFDEDAQSGDDPLGAVVIDLSRVSVNVFSDEWYPIQGGRGELRIQFLFRRLFQVTAALSVPQWEEPAAPSRSRTEAKAEPEQVPGTAMLGAGGEADEDDVEYVAHADLFNGLIQTGEPTGAPGSTTGAGGSEASNSGNDALGTGALTSTTALPALERTEALWGALDNAIDDVEDLRVRRRDEIAALLAEVEDVLGVSVPNAAAKRSDNCTSTCEYLFLSLLSPSHQVNSSSHFLEDDAVAIALDVFLPLFSSEDTQSENGRASAALPPTLVAEAGVFGMGCETAWLWGSSSTHLDASSLCSLPEIHANVLELKRIHRDALYADESIHQPRQRFNVSTVIANTIYPYQERQFHQVLELRGGGESVAGICRTGADYLSSLRARVSHRATVLGNKTTVTEEGRVLAAGPCLEVDSLGVATDPQREPPVLFPGATTTTISGCDKHRSLLSHASLLPQQQQQDLWNIVRQKNNSLPPFALYVRVRGVAYFIKCKDRFSFLQMWARLRLTCGLRGGHEQLLGTGFRVPGPFTAAPFDFSLSAQGIAAMAKVDALDGRATILAMGSDSPVPTRRRKSSSKEALWTDVDLNLDGDRSLLEIQDLKSGRQETVNLVDVEAIGVSDAPGSTLAFKLAIRVKWANLEALFRPVAELEEAASRTPVTQRTAKPFLVLTIVFGRSVQEGRSDRYKSPELPAPIVLPAQRGFRPFWNTDVEFGLPVDLREHAALLITAFTRKSGGRGKGSRVHYLGEHLLPLGGIASASRGFVPHSIPFSRVGRKITLTVHRCGGLIAADRNGKSDPYIKLYAFNAEQIRIKDVQSSSDRTHKTLDPTFEQTFVLDPLQGTVSKSGVRSTSNFAVSHRVAVPYGFGDVAGFELVVYDHDTGFSDDLLGACVVSLQSIAGGGTFEHKRIPLLFGPQQKALPAPGATVGFVEVSARVQLVEDFDEAIRVLRGGAAPRRGSRSMLRSALSSGSSGRGSDSSIARGSDEAGVSEAQISLRMVKLEVESTWWPASTVATEAGAARSADDGAPWEPRFGATLSHDHLVLDPAMIQAKGTNSHETAAQVQASEKRRDHAKSAAFNVLSLARDPENEDRDRDGSIVVEVLENERYSPFLLDWGSRYPGHLLMTDPRQFTNEAGNQSIPIASLHDLKAPLGYAWDGDWELDMPSEHDWSYGFDFWLLHNNFSNGKYHKRSGDGHVRCRRWARTLQVATDNRASSHAQRVGGDAETVRAVADFLSGSLETFASLADDGGIRFHVYENEVRPGDFLDWEPAEPSHTNEAGNQSLHDLDDIPRLPGFHWEGPWALDEHEDGEEGTWTYPEIHDGDEAHSTTSSDIDGCQFRRRRWTRVLRRGHEDGNETRAPSAAQSRRSNFTAARGIVARGIAKGLPLTSIASIHVLSDTTLYVIAYGGLLPLLSQRRTSQRRASRGRDSASFQTVEDDYVHSTHIVLGPLPAMAFGNAILDRLSNMSLSAMLVDLRFLRAQVAAGDVATPFEESLSFVNFAKTSKAAGGTGLHAALQLPEDDGRQSTESNPELNHTFRLNESELVKELRDGRTLSADSKDLIVESAVIERATQTVMLLQHRVELLCKAVRQLQNLSFHLAATQGDLKAEDPSFQARYEANVARDAQLYWTYQRGLLALGKRIRRLVACALEVQSLEIAVPWIEQLLHGVPGRTEPRLHRAVADLVGSRRNNPASPLSLQARGRKGFLDFTPLAAEAEAEATMRALLQASRIAYSLQREKAFFERDLDENAAEATVALQTKGALMDMDEIVNNLIFNLIFKRGIAHTLRQMMAHDVSTPNPAVPLEIVTAAPKDSEAALLAALMYLFPIDTAGEQFDDISCSYSATRFAYLGRVILRRLQDYNATDAGIKTRAGFAGLNLTGLGIIPKHGAAHRQRVGTPKDRAAPKGPEKRSVFDMHKTQQKPSLTPTRLHFSVMESEVLGTVALNAMDSRQECLDFARYLIDDTRERLAQVSLYWSTMSPRFVAPLAETILQAYMIAVNSVLSTFVYDEKFEALNYGNLSAFMKFVRHEFTNAEKVLSQAFTAHPGIWGIVPKPTYQSCLDLDLVTSWYQKCLLDCMRDLQVVVLRQTVDREMKRQIVAANAAASSNDAGSQANVGGFSTNSESLKLLVSASLARGLSRNQADRLRLLLESDEPVVRAYPGTGVQPSRNGVPIPWRWEIMSESTPTGQRGPWHSEMPESLEYALSTYHQLVESIFGDDETMRYTIMQTHAQTAASLARAWNACTAQLPMKAPGNLAFFSAVANDCLRYITHLEDRLEDLPESHSPQYDKVVDAVSGASELFLDVAMRCVRRIALHIYTDVELYAAENQMTYTQGWRLRVEGEAPAPKLTSMPDDGLVRLFVGTVEDYLSELTGGPLHERFLERVLRVLLDLVCRRYLVDMRAFCEAHNAAERVHRAGDEAMAENGGMASPQRRRRSWKATKSSITRRDSGPRQGEVEPFIQRDVAQLEQLCGNAANFGMRTPPELLRTSLQPLQDLLDLVSTSVHGLPGVATRVAIQNPRNPESAARFVFYAMTLRVDVKDVSMHLVRTALIAATAGRNRSPPAALGDMDTPLTDVDEFLEPILEYAPPEHSSASIIIAARPPEMGLPIATMDPKITPAVECAFSDTFLAEVRRRCAGHQHQGAGQPGRDAVARQDGTVSVTVTVHSATGLPKLEQSRFSLSKGATFVELSLHAASGSGRHRTKTKKSDFPVFEQAFTFNLTSLVGATLSVIAMDDRTFKHDRELGTGSVELSTIRVAQPGEVLRVDRRDVDMNPTGIVTITVGARRVAAEGESQS